MLLRAKNAVHCGPRGSCFVLCAVLWRPGDGWSVAPQCALIDIGGRVAVEKKVFVFFGGGEGG